MPQLSASAHHVCSTVSKHKLSMVRLGVLNEMILNVKEATIGENLDQLTTFSEVLRTVFEKLSNVINRSSCI